MFVYVCVSVYIYECMECREKTPNKLIYILSTVQLWKYVVYTCFWCVRTLNPNPWTKTNGRKTRFPYTFLFPCCCFLCGEKKSLHSIQYTSIHKELSSLGTLLNTGLCLLNELQTQVTLL